ncbi:hypothetical protein BH23ACT9_BH23ACT9_14440 [soil metagenome]
MTRVLVVDDDPSVRFTVRVALESAALDGPAMEVQEAVDGPSALGALDLGGVDVVLLDVMMPGQDGLSVLQAIRNSEHREVGVIMLTARGRESNVAEAFRKGADAYVTKPFEIDALAELTHDLATAPIGRAQGRPPAGDGPRRCCCSWSRPSATCPSMTPCPQTTERGRQSGRPGPGLRLTQHMQYLSV